MMKKKIAVIGAGSMALNGGKAFIDTDQAEICGVASKHVETARACAKKLSCDRYFDNYKKIVETEPDALLVEVPLGPQNEIVLWALDEGFDVLIGGCLATSVEYGKSIVELTKKKNRTVEVGFNGRYDPLWVETRKIVMSGMIGKPIMATSMTYFRADPESWYYNEELSGGMPLLHLTYCYLNAMRWVLGTPTHVSATGNKLAQTRPHHISDESCAAVVQYENQSFASVVGSYATPDSLPGMEPQFVCTEGAVKINNRSDPGSKNITVFKDGKTEILSFDAKESSLVRQAKAFLNAMETGEQASNPVEDALIDIEVAEAMAISSKEHRTVRMSDL